MPNKTLVAMGCITAIIITCIFKNIDGALISAGVAAIAGLGGYALAKIKK